MSNRRIRSRRNYAEWEGYATPVVHFTMPLKLAVLRFQRLWLRKYRERFATDEFIELEMKSGEYSHQLLECLHREQKGRKNDQTITSEVLEIWMKKNKWMSNIKYKIPDILLKEEKKKTTKKSGSNVTRHDEDFQVFIPAPRDCQHREVQIWNNIETKESTTGLDQATPDPSIDLYHSDSSESQSDMEIVPSSPPPSLPIQEPTVTLNVGQGSATNDQSTVAAEPALNSPLSSNSESASNSPCLDRSTSDTAGSSSSFVENQPQPSPAYSPVILTSEDRPLCSQSQQQVPSEGDGVVNEPQAIQENSPPQATLPLDFGHIFGEIAGRITSSASTSYQVPTFPTDLSRSHYRNVSLLPPAPTYSSFGASATFPMTSFGCFHTTHMNRPTAPLPYPISSLGFPNFSSPSYDLRGHTPSSNYNYAFPTPMPQPAAHSFQFVHTPFYPHSNLSPYYPSTVGSHIPPVGSHPSNDGTGTHPSNVGTHPSNVGPHLSTPGSQFSNIRSPPRPFTPESCPSPVGSQPSNIKTYEFHHTSRLTQAKMRLVQNRDKLTMTSPVNMVSLGDIKEEPMDIIEVDDDNEEANQLPMDTAKDENSRDNGEEDENPSADVVEIVVLRGDEDESSNPTS